MTKTRDFMCPLLSVGKVSSMVADRGNSHSTGYALCQKERCAWWMPTTQSDFSRGLCAVVFMAIPGAKEFGHAIDHLARKQEKPSD